MDKIDGLTMNIEQTEQDKLRAVWVSALITACHEDSADQNNHMQNAKGIKLSLQAGNYDTYAGFFCICGILYYS